MSAQRLQLVGGSMDGKSIRAVRDGKPVKFAYRSSTREVWLRHGDELRLAPGASMEDGFIAFSDPEGMPPA